MPTANSETTSPFTFMRFSLCVGYEITFSTSAAQSKRPDTLNKQADVGIPRKPHKRGRAAVFDVIDEFALVELEQVNRHLTSDEFNVRLQAQIAQLLQRGHAMRRTLNSS